MELRVLTRRRFSKSGFNTALRCLYIAKKKKFLLFPSAYIKADFIHTSDIDEEELLSVLYLTIKAQTLKLLNKREGDTREAGYKKFRRQLMPQRWC